MKKTKNRAVNHPLARAFSLLAAFTTCGLFYCYPIFFGSILTAAQHGAMSLSLLGACVGVVHGLGYQPSHPVTLVILHPIMGWLLLFLGWLCFLTA